MSGPTLGDSGSGSDELHVHRSATDEKLDELDDWRDRADRVGVDWHGVPLVELRAMVQEAEARGAD